MSRSGRLLSSHGLIGAGLLGRDTGAGFLLLMMGAVASSNTEFDSLSVGVFGRKLGLKVILICIIFIVERIADLRSGFGGRLGSRSLEGLENSFAINRLLNGGFGGSTGLEQMLHVLVVIVLLVQVIAIHG